MDYSCDNKRAQEIARLTIPLMTRLNIPVNPINYALWYEYHLGRNAELVDILQSVESGDKVLDPEQAKTLFLRYVATPDVEAL